MSINENTISVEPKDGDSSTFPLPVTAVAVRQSDGTARDVTATDKFPVTDAGALAAGTALGTTADAPLAGDTAESETARTGISLWKRFVNKLIEIKAILTGQAADITQLNAFTAHGKTIADMETIPVSISGASVGTLHADTEGKHFLLMGFQGTMDGAGTYQFREADDAPVYSGTIKAAETGGISMPPTGFQYATTADGKGLEMVTTGDGLNGMAQILEVDN